MSGAGGGVAPGLGGAVQELWAQLGGCRAWGMRGAGPRVGVLRGRVGGGAVGCWGPVPPPLAPGMGGRGLLEGGGCVCPSPLPGSPGGCMTWGSRGGVWPGHTPPQVWQWPWGRAGAREGLRGGKKARGCVFLTYLYING